ncbi:MAG: methyltransferase domain-containing protein [Elusimicrobia bacterium]|nr:methyltransferase domain-containing protein [Candidatus Obscuribacterium magneticum]
MYIPQNEKIQNRAGDRRSNPRFEIPLKVKLKDLEVKKEFEAKINNISRGGLRFLINEGLNLIKDYEINLDCPNFPNLSFPITLLGTNRSPLNFDYRARFVLESFPEFEDFLESIQTNMRISDRRICNVGFPAKHKDNCEISIGKDKISTNSNNATHLNENKTVVELAERNMSKAVDSFVKLASSSNTSPSIFFHQVISSIHDLCARIAICEQTGIPKEKILQIISDARAIHSNSPFIKRLQVWPRGYIGDFETIEWLIKQKNNSNKEKIEFVLEQYALGSMIAQQHRNKVQYQAFNILECINKSIYNCPKILIMACGSSPDVRLITKLIRGQKFQLVLIDSDPDAIKFSIESLYEIGSKCKFIEGNIFTKIGTLSKLGPFDLIVAGGLFDYLNDKQIKFLVQKSISKLLKPLGKFFFSNIAAGNPYRHWIEYLANWTLIERREGQIFRLLNSIGIETENIRFYRDPTGLSIFTEITNSVFSDINEKDFPQIIKQKVL